MNRHAFLFDLQQRGHAYDWFPFDQDQYIKDVMHGRIPTKSRFADGICAALSFKVLDDWMKNGIRIEAVGNLGNFPVTEEINAAAETIKNADTFKQAMLTAGHACTKDNYFLEYKSAIEHTTRAGFALLALGGITKTGHAIVCNGHEGAIFDPNVGYIKSRTIDGYTWAFLRLMQQFNAEFSGPGKAVRTFEFA
jgi:hypothetical protein